MYMEQLTEHHQKLWAFIHSLQEYETTAGVRTQAKEISSIISKLSGILSVHLAAEDNYLYPALQKNTNPQIQQTAAKFSAEMGTLSKGYSSYKAKFMLASQIEAAPADFLKETAVILDALTKRLQREDTELYPLLNK